MTKDIFRKNFLSLVMILLITPSAMGQHKISNNSLGGYWISIIDDPMGKLEFVMILSETEINVYEGEIHVYQNGSKYPSLKMGAIDFTQPNVTMVTNPEANVLYKGIVDLENGVMKGNIIQPSGLKIPSDIVRYNKDYIKENFNALISKKEENYSYRQPIKLNDGIIVTTAAAEKVSTEKLEKLVNAVTSGEFGAFHSILVMKNGKLVLEEYFDAYSAEDLHMLQSCTKSISSLLVGIAIDKGLIKNVEMKIPEFFPDLSEKINKEWNKVSLRDLLKMSAGVNWDNNADDSINVEDPNYLLNILQRPIKVKPGEMFEYRSPNTNLIAGIIKNVSGMRADKFSEQYLFKPLGIELFNWHLIAGNSLPDMSGSLGLKPRDMIKIGLLVLNNGKWGDKQIISENWITESTSKQIITKWVLDYGYFWWTGQSKKHSGISAIVAMGLGSQLIVIIPELNVVAVTTGYNMEIDEYSNSLRIFEKYLLPAVRME
jgi:CubicO group peptidase (beta-lactamase class C family)